MASFTEWSNAKKKKTGDGKTGTLTSQGTSSSTSAKGSSFDEWSNEKKKKKETSTLEGWGNASSSNLKETQNYFSTWRSEKDEDGVYSAMKDQRYALLAQADNWRKQYADNKEALSYINSVVSALSDVGGSAKNYFDYYSKWDSEDSYNQYVTQQKEYEGMKTADLVAGAKEVEDLQGILDQMNTLKSGISILENAPAYAPGPTANANKKTAYANELAKLEQQYGSYDDIKNQLAQKTEYLKEAKYVQGYEGYMGNANAEDYATNSQYASTRTDVEMDDALWGLYKNQYDESKLFGDYLYDYINRNQDALDVATVNNTATNSYFLGLDQGFLQTMTEDEIGVYNYLYNTQGKESADAFLTYIGSDLQGRRRAQENAKWAAYAQESPVGSSVFSTLVSPLKGLSYLGQAADMLDDGAMEENAGYNRFSEIPSTIRSQVSTTIENSGKWGKVGSFAYNTGMSMADFLFTTAVSGGNQALSLAIMGSGAAADSTLAAKKRGLDDGQAFALGTIAGLAEVAMEKVSLSAWLEGDMSEGALRYILKNALSEGGEEASTSVVNLLADIIIAGDKSEWNMAMQAYMAEGKTEAEAFGLVLAENAAQIGLDALGGVLSGAAIGGGTYAGSSAVSSVQYKDIAKDKTASQNLVSESLELSPDSQYAQKMQGKLDNGKNLTGMQVRNLLAANQEQITTNDKKLIQQAAEKRLADLGQTEDVSKVAELATKYATGGELTRSEKSILTRSQYGSRVANELLPTNILSGDYSSEWAENIGTKSVNKYTYNIKSILEEMMKVEDPAAYKSITERVGEEGRYGVAESGETTLRNENEAVRIAEVVTIDDGQMTVKLDDGREVYAGDIDFASDDESRLYSAVADMEHMTPAAATALVHAYDPTSEQSVTDYVNGIDEAYTYGYYGYAEADLKAGNFTSNLTSEQMMSAYRLGQSAKKIGIESKNEQIVKMRTAAEAKAVAKNATTTKKDLTGSDAEVYFMDGKATRKFDESGKYDDKRMAGVNYAKFLSKLGIGSKFFFYESYIKDGKRVYKDANGNEVNAPNGFYKTDDGSIYIDLNAGDKGDGFTLYTLGHELTHFIKQWSADKFQVLADFLIEEYGKTDMSMHQRVLEKQSQLEKTRGEEVSYDEAFEEVVADAMSTMLSDGNLHEKLAKLKAQDKGLFNKIKKFFEQLVAKFKKVYAELTPDQKDAQDVQQMKDAFDRIQTAFAEALVEANENFQASLTPGVESIVTNETGDPVAYSTEDGSVMLSIRTYEENGRTELRKYLDKCVSSNQLTKAEMQEMIDGIEEIYNICKEFKDKYAPFSSWSDAAVVRDTHGRPVFSVVTPNVDYKMNLDFSLVCKKRRTLDAVFNEMSKRGIIDDFELGQKSVVKINEIIRRYGLETACALCFVDAKRFRQASMADSFTSLYNELVMSLVPEDKRSSIGHFNFAGYETIKAVENGIHTWKASDLDFSHLDYVMKNYASGTVEHKAAKYIKANAEGRKLLLRGDFMSSKGFDAVKTQNQSILKLYNAKKGTGGPKAAFGDVQYLNEIVKKARTWTPAKAYEVGGVRIQSFSDYVPRMVFDYVQMIYDLAATKLPAHAYTKEALFVKQFGLTGVKINMSLIPAIADGGIAPGLDAKGNYVWAGESFDFDTAKQIQNAEGYSENCGTICVGVSDLHIRKMLNDPNIRMVIPYHKSGLNPIVAHMNKIAAFNDYTNDQRTKGADGKALEKDFDFNKALHDMGANGDPKAVVQQYLNWCDENGYTAKFSQFRDHANYYKLLEDFTVYDKDGNYVPQREVRAVFPKDGAAFGSMKELIESGLEEDAIVEGKRDSSLSSIVDEIQRTLPKTEAEISEEQVAQADHDLESVKRSDRDSQGKSLSEDQKEYFADSKARDENGNLYVLYHGSRSPVFTEFDLYEGVWLTPDANYAENYADWTDDEPMGLESSVYENPNSRIYKMYANITNPIDIGELNVDLDIAGIDRLAKLLGVPAARIEAIASDYGYKYGVFVYEVTRTKEFIDIAREKGYDGFVATEAGNKTFCAIGSPNQVKLTTNEVPSGFSDIRYSDRTNPYSYEALVSKPDMNVTTVDGNVPNNRADVVYQAKQNAAKVGKLDPKTGSVSVYVDDIGADVLLSTDGLRHGLRRTKNPGGDANYIVTVNAGGIIKNSIKVNEVNAKKHNASGAYVLIGAARSEGGDLYIVRSVVNQFKNELAAMDVLYAINAKKEPAALNAPRSTAEPLSVTGSTITIAELLDLVNQHFPDILPEEVLKHYGYDARPGGDLGGEMLYSERTGDSVSNRSLLANAFEGIVQNSIEYEMLQDYKDRIKALNKLEAKLSDLNREIRKIRFTEGEYDAKKLRELESEAKKVSQEINRHDWKLLNLEASEPLRRVIDRERKKEAQKTRDHVKQIQQNKKDRAEQTELRQKIRKKIRDLDKLLNRGNKKLNVKEDMKGFVSKALELADYLFTDHVSNDELIRKGITVRMTQREAALVKETEEILSKIYDHADSITDEEFTRLDAKRKANEDKLRDLLTAQRNERLQTPVYNLFSDLVTEYSAFKNSSQDAVKAAYNPEVERFLRTYVGDEDSDRAKTLKNMRVADMTTEELWKLDNAYQMVLHAVRTANKLFVKGNTESIEQVVTQIVMDFGSRKIPEKKMAIAMQKLGNKIGWDYEKLYYALDRIGSQTFTDLIMNLANSENIVMQDVMEAAAFRDKIVEKYGFNNWDVNKEIDREFLDTTGKKFKMTLGQLMSLYAYSRREGAWDHIEYGGFVFGEAALTNPKPADSFKLSKEQCEAITGTLTKEQKSYVEDMQKFLSETMGGKGNEVSMMLYGIKMFGEKNYFPIHIAGQFKAQAQESQAKQAAGFGSMSNAGFTHAQNPQAKAPFVLEGFNDVWSDHVNEMSRYHGTVPALEDLRRVMNRSSYSENTAESTSVKVIMENHYGKEAVEYFDNLYREANSGAITDKLQHTSKKLLSLFRKNSVAYSLSVLVQQPASLVRAYAVIDRKYFGFKGVGAITSGVAKAVSSKWNKAYENAYNEMMKYAPGVTMTKEIGGFDTATGGSIRSYLLDTDKSFKQKWKTGTAKEKGQAVMDLVDENPIANLPNVADKIAWIEIWNACKRETLAKHKDLAPTSDEFMKIVGDRFTEVIRATQVYDSIFAKSPMLKSKNLAVQMLVSFMNEPNTVANMAESAVRDFTKGNRMEGLKKAHVLIHSIIFTGVMKSIIYAMRDDDEDETYIEKYIESLTGSLMDDFNPLNYIPIARDVWSVAQGYDVERADMAIVADAISALNKVIKTASTDRDGMTEDELIELDKKVTEASWTLAESLAAFVGIPMKNIRREINAMIDHAKIASANAGKTTAMSTWDTISEAVIDSIPFMGSKSKTDKLYAAIIEGDTEYTNRLKATYKTEDSYHTAVRKALRENDPRIKEAAQAHINGDPSKRVSIAKQIIADGFILDDVVAAINTEINAMTTSDSGSDTKKEKGVYTSADIAIEAANGDWASVSAIKDDIIQTAQKNGKTKDEAEDAFVSTVQSNAKEAYFAGTLNDEAANRLLVEYAGKDEDEAAETVRYWAFCRDNPAYKDFSKATVGDYYEFAEPANIPMDVYAQFINGTKGLADIKDEWGDVVKSKREQVLEVIDSLSLSWKQKDALYRAAGYAESKIWDVPW